VSDGEGPGRARGQAASVLHAWLARQDDDLRELDPLVRSQQPGAVHGMRVTVRRLRSVLATYRPLLDPTITDPLRAELTWLGHQLGGARDAEVTHARLARALVRAEPLLVHGPVVDRLEKDLGESTRRAHQEAVAAMASPRYSALRAGLDELATDPPLTTRAHEWAGDVLPPLVRHEWRRATRRALAVAGTGDAEERAALLHEVRKASKRLRYAAEPLVELYGDDARRFVKAVKRVQSTLGIHHDSVVARAYLLAQADRAAAEGEDTFTYGVLYVREQAAARRAEAQFRRRWEQASRRKLRRWLA